jgi:hypothetical protein
MLIETIRVAPVSAPIADNLGAFALYAIATAAGVPLLVDADSRSHGGKLYWPGKDAHGNDEAALLGELQGLADSPHHNAAARDLVRAAIATHATRGS